MRDGPNHDHAFLHRTNNGKRKSPKEKLTRAALPDRPPLRTFTDRSQSSIQFFDKVRRGFGAAPAIPHHCFFYVCRRTLMIANAANGHSTSPTALDAVLPKGQSQLCPPAGLAYDALLLHPRRPERIRLYVQGCRAACWPMLRVRQPRGRGPVSADQRLLDSWNYCTSPTPPTEHAWSS